MCLPVTEFDWQAVGLSLMDTMLHFEAGEPDTRPAAAGSSALSLLCRGTWLPQLLSPLSQPDSPLCSALCQILTQPGEPRGQRPHGGAGRGGVAVGLVRSWCRPAVGLSGAAGGQRPSRISWVTSPHTSAG